MKTLVFMTEDGYVHAIAVERHRTTLWYLLFSKEEGEEQFFEWRINERLPEYSFKEFINLDQRAFEEVIRSYTQGRGLPALMEIEE